MTQGSSATQNSNELSKIFPSAVITILLTETAERFAYYGYRAILILYFTEQLHLNENTSISFFAYTTSLAYVMPLFGALISDAFFGKYKTILAFGSIYVIGIGILTFAAYDVFSTDDGGVNWQVVLTFLGLVLICIGTGGIKPCVSPFGADQLLYSDLSQTSSPQRTDADNYDFQCLASSSSSTSFDSIKIPSPNSNQNHSANDDIVQKFFAWFYFGINVGSLASFLIIPSIRATYGFGAAFLLPTIFISMAMLLFVSKKREYIIVTPSSMRNSQHQGTSMVNVLRIYKAMLREQICRTRTASHSISFSALSSSPSSIAQSKEISSFDQYDISVQDQEDAKKVLKLFPVFAAFPVFWMLFDQQGSVWILQANNMNLHGIQPEQLGVLNPLFIMILIPLFDQHIYPFCQKNGWSSSHLRRISWGMVFAALSFFVSGILEHIINENYEESNDDETKSIDHDQHKISIFWQIPQIFLLSISEILISVTGLEFAYAHSPRSMKALIMASFQMTTAVGDLFGGALYSILSSLERDIILNICGALMLMNLLLFKRIEDWWNKQHVDDSKEKQSNEFESDFEDECHIIS